MITPQEITDLRLCLLRVGYEPIPLIGKVPTPKQWQKLHGVSQEQVEMWGRTWPDAVNTGMLTHDAPTLDADLLKPDAAVAVEDMVREKFEARGHVMTRIGRPPKRAYPFRTDQPFKKITINFEGEEKLEFLGDGQQVVVNGIHPDTQKPYAWFGGEPGPVAREDLPSITEAEAHELMECAAEMLVKDFGYVRAASRPNREEGNGKTHTGGSADWKFLADNIHEGRELHDTLCSLAAKLVTAGTSGGAAVNLLRAMMDGSSALRDFRWQSRYDDIPRLVDSAEQFRDGNKGTASTGTASRHPPRHQSKASPRFTRFSKNGLARNMISMPLPLPWPPQRRSG